MATTPPPGYINKGYSINRQIGKGVFGKIYSVAKESETFAMKELTICETPEEDVYRFSTVTSEEKKLRVLKEIANLTKVRDNRNVLFFEDSFSDGLNKMYIVTEYCRHGDLKKVLHSGDPMLANERFIAIVMAQLCCGLEFIHSMKVVHNDITIENIFVQSGGVIKIGDFGLSEDLTDATAQSETQAFQRDIYAAGTVLFELGRRGAQRHLNEIQGDTNYLKTLTERIRCISASDRPGAEALYPLFRKIERKLRGRDGIVSIIISSWDKWIAENEVAYNDDDNDDGSDDYLTRLVGNSLPM